MARTTTPLTDTKIRTAKPKDKIYKLYDGGGLFIEVTPKGGKHWKLKYRLNDKEKKLSLGSYPTITLIKARSLRDENKILIADGIDPSEKKKSDKQAEIQKEHDEANTFKKLALQRLDKVQSEISESHYKRTLRGFENDVFPLMGDKPINDITADDIITILQTMEKRGVYNSIKKVYQSIGKTFKWAVSNRLAQRNPAQDIDINELLVKKEVKSYATLTSDADIKKLLTAIENYQGEYTTKQALKFMSYTAVRSINIREAEWSEIDFKTKQWNIPASKMKTNNDLIVPLTPSAIKVLEDIKEFTGGYKYIFPSVKHKDTPLSDNTLRVAIRRMGIGKDEFTPHGFRSMFSSIAHEKSNFKYEAIEIQLAHSVGNSVSQAYNRAKYLDERRELMQWWSDYLDEVKR